MITSIRSISSSGNVAKDLAPAVAFAHPTVEHFTPLFVTLGAASNPEDVPETLIEGFWMGLSKRSLLVA